MITNESGSGRQPIEVPLFDGSRFGISQFGLLVTLPETNIAPENRPSQKETSIPTIHF